MVLRIISSLSAWRTDNFIVFVTFAPSSLKSERRQTGSTTSAGGPAKSAACKAFMVKQ
jgi:hypothetical protein